MIQKRMEQYRNLLLKAGMNEPSRMINSEDHLHWLFFKQTSLLTAFIVNLRGTTDGVCIVYGYASTAFTRMVGDENALAEYGISDENITIRESITVQDEDSEESADERIRDMYIKYLNTDKNDLLAYAQERRKAFLQQIAVRLKPRGFKKKANIWTRELNGGFRLKFGAQKSSYSDEYYFNIHIDSDRGHPLGCYSSRVALADMFLVDWQLLNQSDFQRSLDDTVLPLLNQIIQVPLKKLGSHAFIWHDCACPRNVCKDCWVEKNMWEAKE